MNIISLRRKSINLKGFSLFPSDNGKNCEKGQSLVEFLLLLLVMFSMSFMLIGGMGNIPGLNDAVGSVWTTYASTIAADDITSKPTLTLR
jgi:hypothetical protein